MRTKYTALDELRRLRRESDAIRGGSPTVGFCHATILDDVGVVIWYFGLDKDEIIYSCPEALLLEQHIARLLQLP